MQIVNISYNIIVANYIGIICCGISLRKIKEIENFKNCKRNFSWFILIFLGIVYTFLSKDTSSTLFIIPSLIIIYFVLNNNIKFLENSFIQKIGKIFYPLYLIHQNIGYAIEYYSLSIFGISFFEMYGVISFVIILILSIVVYKIIIFLMTNNNIKYINLVKKGN